MEIKKTIIVKQKESNNDLPSLGSFVEVCVGKDDGPLDKRHEKSYDWVQGENNHHISK